MKLQVQHLKVGDILSGSKEKVIGLTYNSIDLPSGKCWVKLEKKSRYQSDTMHVRIATWRKNTIVNIEERTNEH